MADTNQVAGVTKITKGGIPYRVRGSVEFQPLDISQESVVGLDGYHGVKSMPVAPHLEFEITVGDEVSLKALQSGTGQTLVADCPGGRQLILLNAAYIGTASYDPGEGKVKLRYEGSRAAEVTPA